MIWHAKMAEWLKCLPFMVVCDKKMNKNRKGLSILWFIKRFFHIEYWQVLPIWWYSRLLFFPNLEILQYNHDLFTEKHAILQLIHTLRMCRSLKKLWHGLLCRAHEKTCCVGEVCMRNAIILIFFNVYVGNLEKCH
jgi:hypothetical protein